MMRSVLTVATAAAVLSPLVALPAQAAPVTSPTSVVQAAGCVADVVTDGHFDFGPTMDGSEMVARIKDDRSSPPEWIDPGTVVLHLTDTAAVTPPGGEFEFLGDDQIWQIPLTQQSGVPWLGWNTQHPTIAGHVDGAVTLRLDSLDGPGELAVYSLNSFGGLGERYFGTMEGFGSSTDIPVGGSGVHVHAVWAFDTPGTYRANVTYSAMVDGAARSDSAVLTFHIGDSAAPTDCTSSGDGDGAANGGNDGAGDGAAGAGASGSGDGAGGGAGEEGLAETGFDDPVAEDALGLAVTLLFVGGAFAAAALLHPQSPVNTRRLGTRPRTATRTEGRKS